MSNDKSRPNKKIKNKTVSITQRNKKDVSYSIFVFIALGALIFYPPYVRGLFFQEDMFLFYILTAIVFTLVLIDKISRKEYTFLSTPLDWAVVAYAGAYLLSLIGAVHPGEATYGFLKALNYFMIYWMVSQMVRNYLAYERLVQILVTSGVGVAIIGILAATGYSKYPAAFDGQVILSTMQYRNATAAFLVVMTILGTTLWSQESKKYIRPLYSIANYLMILVVLGTMSKGGWLVLALGAILLVIGMPGQYRIKTIYSLAMSGLAAIAAAIKFLPAITSGNTDHALPYLLLGFVVLLIGELFWNFLIFSNRRWGKAIVIGGVALLLIALLGSGLLTTGKSAVFNKDLQSSTIAAQAQKIGNLSDFSYTSRIDIYRWGIDIAKDHPIFGVGAGGWNALYHQYQDYLFFTTEVHNHFLQVLIEAGLIGLMAFLAMWAILILIISKQSKQLRVKQEELEADPLMKHWILNWGVAVAALTAGAHAFIDFDLSLGAICIVLWTLFALINAGSRIDQLYTEKPHNIWILVGVGMILIMIPLITGQRMLAAHNLYQGSSNLFNQALAIPVGPEKGEKLKNVEEMASQSRVLDPLNANYSALLAQSAALQYEYLSNQQDPNSAEKIQVIREAIRSTEKLSPYDIKVRSAMINSCLLIKDFPTAIQQANYLVTANPNDVNAYSAVINLTMAAAEQSLNKNDQRSAIDYLENAIQYAEKMDSQKAKIDPRKTQEPYWKGAPLTLNSETQLSLGKAYFLLGNYTRSQELLLPLINAQLNPALQHQAWCLAAIQKNGAPAEYQPMIQQIQASDPQAAALFNNLIRLAPLKK